MESVLNLIFNSLITSPWIGLCYYKEKKAVAYIRVISKWNQENASFNESWQSKEKCTSTISALTRVKCVLYNDIISLLSGTHTYSDYKRAQGSDRRKRFIWHQQQLCGQNIAYKNLFWRWLIIFLAQVSYRFCGRESNWELNVTEYLLGNNRVSLFSIRWSRKNERCSFLAVGVMRLVSSFVQKSLTFLTSRG